MVKRTYQPEDISSLPPAQWLLLVLLAFAACTMNDSENDRVRPNRRTTGPVAKNTPTQKKVATPVIVRQHSSTRKKWGGAIKNTQPWHETEAARYRTLGRRKTRKPKGPRAKNSRP